MVKEILLIVVMPIHPIPSPDTDFEAKMRRICRGHIQIPIRHRQDIFAVFDSKHFDILLFEMK